MRRHFSTLLATVMVGLCLGAAADAKTFRWARGQDAPPSILTPRIRTRSSACCTSSTNRSCSATRRANWCLPRAELGTEAERPDVWVFKLRPNVTFHNGDKFTADDAVFSLKRAMDPLAGLRTTLAGVTDVTKVDDLTIEVKTAAPCRCW